MPDPGCAGHPGTEVTNFEELDKSYNFSTALVADFTGGGTLGQVYTQLDPDHMQRKLVDGKCAPVYPHEYVRTNTIFEVIKEAGRRTAWSDKHPAYEDLSGPSGKGIDELYAPEINSQDTPDNGAQTGDDYTTSYHRRSHLRLHEGERGAELDRRLEQHGNRSSSRSRRSLA